LIGQRIAIIGNAGGGKSTLARRLAASHDLPLTEVDKLLWQPGWKITPEEEYDALHQPLIDSD
jgi:adenylate kinase family enzyme